MISVKEDLLCLVAQLCPIIFDTMNCSPPGSSVHGDSPGKNTKVGCHAFFLGKEDIRKLLKRVVKHVSKS